MKHFCYAKFDRSIAGQHMNSHFKVFFSLFNITLTGYPLITNIVMINLTDDTSFHRADYPPSQKKTRI